MPSRNSATKSSNGWSPYRLSWWRAVLLPGIAINTSPTDFAPIKQMQMEKFNGERWELFGPVLTGAGGAS